MFETLVMTKRERTAVRTALAFPAAMGLQIALVSGTLLYSFLHIPGLAPPPLMAGSYFQVAIPVVVPIRKAEQKTNTEQARPQPRSDGSAPAEVPVGIQVSTFTPGNQDVTGDRDGVIGGRDPEPGEVLPQQPVTTPVRAPQPIWTVHMPQLLTRVEPAYPPPAISMRLEGRVVLQIVVNEEGRVVEAKVQQSTNPMFEEAALSAARQWRYSRPIDAQSGQAVSCYMTVVVNFKMR